MGVRVTTGLLLEATGEEEPAGAEELTAGVETTEEEGTTEGATEGATEGMELEATEGAEEVCTVEDSSGADTAEEEAVGVGSAAVGTTRTVEVEASAPGVTERARTRRAWRPS
jgi:hypothetical protein